MLLTMEHEYRNQNVRMPNEERLDKVDESMERLEEVVRERNQAFWELEVGTDGEPQRQIIPGPFGLDEGYLQKEHRLPQEINERWKAHMNYRYRTNLGLEVRTFYRKYMEQQHKKLMGQKFRQLRKAAKTIRRFPKTDPEALEEKFPMVTYGEVKRYYQSKGHRRNEDLER